MASTRSSPNSGAKDCVTYKDIYEVVSSKEDFYKVKSELDKHINEIVYSGIDWLPNSYISLNKDQSVKIAQILDHLDELDDVQNIFTNANLKNL